MMFWGAMFLLSIIGLIAIGYHILYLYGDPKTWQEWVLRAVTKSPIIIGLFILEEFSRRRYASVLSVEEDYAYKEALSMSFEGYAKQMKEAVSGPDSPTSKLNNNLLDALAQYPGRFIKKDGASFLRNIIDALSPRHDDANPKPKEG